MSLILLGVKLLLVSVYLWSSWKWSQPPPSSRILQVIHLYGTTPWGLSRLSSFLYYWETDFFDLIRSWAGGSRGSDLVNLSSNFKCFWGGVRPLQPVTGTVRLRDISVFQPHHQPPLIQKKVGENYESWELALRLGLVFPSHVIICWVFSLYIVYHSSVPLPWVL